MVIEYQYFGRANSVYLYRYFFNGRGYGFGTGEKEKMKRFFECTLSIIGVILIVCFSVSARTYNKVFPAFVPVSGGAWCEVQTSQGRATFVVPADYISGYFGFTGDGYNIANVSNSTINGTIYAQTNFDFYGSPQSLQCRFTRQSGLEVYRPYHSTYGTSYTWESLSITEIHNTNIGFVDDTGKDRQNDAYRYTTDQRLNILVISVLSLFGLFAVGRCIWRA